MNKKILIDTYLDTQNKCITGKFSNLEKGYTSSFNSKDTKLTSINYLPRHNKTNIQVINDLVLDVTQKVYDGGERNIMVLNLASSYCPGGGVANGAVAQEEDLFRKTNYFLMLNKKFYPIPKGNVIYTDKVYVIKDNKFNDLENPFPVSMLAAAAIKDPELVNGRYNQPDYNTMKETIENIFKVAYLANKETLILGALGCGAYNNPPKIIISIFNEYLKKYNGCFKNIIFAVYSNKYNDNYDLFDKGIIRIFS